MIDCWSASESSLAKCPSSSSLCRLPPLCGESKVERATRMRRAACLERRRSPLWLLLRPGFVVHICFGPLHEALPLSPATRRRKGEPYSGFKLLFCFGLGCPLKRSLCASNTNICPCPPRMMFWVPDYSKTLLIKSRMASEGHTYCLQGPYATRRFPTFPVCTLEQRRFQWSL